MNFTDYHLIKKKLISCTKSLLQLINEFRFVLLEDYSNGELFGGFYPEDISRRMEGPNGNKNK